MVGLAGFATLLTAVPVMAPEAAPLELGWLNVRDFGATGSSFETTARTTAGSNRIELKELGDFAVGQHVIVSRCFIQYPSQITWGPGEPYSSCQWNKVDAEFSGYDGSAGSWLVFLLEIDGAEPLTFRWSDDQARTWKASKVPVTFDWQPLSGGVSVRLAKKDWRPGHMITVSARDQLVARIEAVDGTTVTLDQAANRAADDAVVRHCDGPAIQAAIDQAIKDRRNLFFPAGHYRLSGRLIIRDANLTLQGVAAEQVLMDIVDGEGAIFSLYGGQEVTIRNFSMVGHTGLAERAGAFRTSSGNGFWACCLKSCNAVAINATERVLVDNVHARRMASECFYSQGPSRTGTKEPPTYTKAITYLRCSVKDCAANAFNNNDLAENTSILNCRVEDAGHGGWHAWEGPSRFIKVIGNTFRNAGPVTIGDMSHRYAHLNELGCGQAVVADNVFEGGAASGGIVVNHGSGQVVIHDNLFINYNGNAIRAASYTVRTSYPSRNVIIRGNSIDLTCVGDAPRPRCGIFASIDDAIVSDNQVFVRGGLDDRVEGIRVDEPALNVLVHGNLVRNCFRGIATGRIGSRVTEVVDATTFVESGLPLQWEVSHRYRGWRLVWVSGEQAGKLSVIDRFDPETLRFSLREALPMKVGDRFEVCPPAGANWRIAGNTVTGCRWPVVLDSYGSSTSVVANNTIDRGGATKVERAITLAGRFAVEGNRLHGFDEPGCQPIGKQDDRLKSADQAVVRDNQIDPPAG